MCLAFKVSNQISLIGKVSNWGCLTVQKSNLFKARWSQTVVRIDGKGLKDSRRFVSDTLCLESKRSMHWAVACRRLGLLLADLMAEIMHLCCNNQWVKLEFKAKTVCLFLIQFLVQFFSLVFLIEWFNRIVLFNLDRTMPQHNLLKEV